MKKKVNETENTRGDGETEADVETEAQTEEGQDKKDGSPRAKARKILGIVLDVVLYLFLALCVFALIVSLTSKKNDGATNIFGHEMRIVISSSMEKSENSVDVSQYKIKDIPVRSVVFIDLVPEDESKKQEWYDGLQVGDVLTFKYYTGGRQEVITHRIIEITRLSSGGYRIDLKGDNRAEGSDVSTQTIYTSPQDYPNSNAQFNEVIGKVTGQSVVLGNIMYVLSQPVGLALIVIVPCAIIIIWQIVRVIAVFSGERKKKAALKLAEAERLAAAESEERERQARELEELKQKLAQLEQQKSVKDGEDSDVGENE